MDGQDWVLKGHVAQWRTANVTASVDLLQPGRGLSHVQVGDQAWPHVSLMGFELPGLSESVHATELAESFARQSELGFSYAMTTSSQLHSQVVWRSLRSEEAVGLHWILSVRTPRLDARPLVRLRNRVPGRFADVMKSSDGRSLGGAGDSEFAVRRADTDGLSGSSSTPWSAHSPIVIYRPHGSQISLVQTVYPGDLLSYSVKPESEGENPCVTWDLLDEHLEKGVIRRIQAAVWWVPRATDVAQAQRLYDTWLASPPPLD